jgi:hypothetical protein
MKLMIKQTGFQATSEPATLTGGIMYLQSAKNRKPAIIRGFRENIYECVRCLLLLTAS